MLFARTHAHIIFFFQEPRQSNNLPPLIQVPNIPPQLPNQPQSNDLPPLIQVPNIPSQLPNQATTTLTENSLIQADGINIGQVDNEDCDDGYISESDDKGKRRFRATRHKKKRRVSQKMHCHPSNFNKKYAKSFQGRRSISGKDIKDGDDDYIPQSDEESDEESECEETIGDVNTNDSDKDEIV